MTEKTKGLVLAGLIGVAALVWYYEGRGPSLEATARAEAGYNYRPLAVENPELQRSKLDASRKTEYKGGRRDLFSEVAPPPEVQAQVAKKRLDYTVQQPPPPPPPALPASLKFFGYGTIPNGTAKRAFLSDGEQIYIVGEGETLLGKYRVVRIGNANLDFEEIATGRRGSTTLTEEPAVAPAS
jgi:hypothetical protein